MPRLHPNRTWLQRCARFLYDAKRPRQRRWPNRSGARAPFFSPDGKWVGFYQGGQLKKVAIRGGAPVRLCEAQNPYGASWGADDTVVFGQRGVGILRVMAVRVQREPSFAFGNAAVVFGERYFVSGGVGGRSYDISPDGKRFLMIKEPGEAASTELNLVLNWFEELERLVPTGPSSP